MILKVVYDNYYNTILYIKHVTTWNFHVTFIFLIIMSEYNEVIFFFSNRYNNTSHY
jgi:hypothetical protein